MSSTDTGLTAKIEVVQEEEAFLAADAAATAERIAAEPAGAVTAQDRSFGLDEPDAVEADEAALAGGDGPPAAVVEAAVNFGASEQEDYALRDPR